MTEKKKRVSKEYPVACTDTLLSFLLAHVKGKSRNTVKGLLSRRQVLVNGKIITKFDHPLRLGQTVTLLPPPEYQPIQLPFDLLYEDDDLLVIDKPAGLLTIATETEKAQTAYHILTDYVKERNPANRIFIVHRLDRDTSGVVLFAKNEAMKLALQENWSDAVEKRFYEAVVEGRPPLARGTCRSWLLETVTHLVWSAGPDSGGKEAITHYEVLATQGPYSLLRLSLDTGRKNQIRVQLQELGCPVAGDKPYGAATNPIGRLCLHSGTLAFIDPRTQRRRQFTAPLPTAFQLLFSSRNKP